MTLLIAGTHGPATLSAGARALLDIDLIAVAILLLLPTWIALARRHSQALEVFLINLLLAWTGIGWIYALVLALRNKPRNAAELYVCRNCNTIAAPAVRPRRWFVGSDAWNAAKLYDAVVPPLSCPRCHAPNPVPLDTPAGREFSARGRAL